MKGTVKKIDEELNKYNELYKDIIAKYARKKEDGTVDFQEDGSVIIPNENIADANREITELNNIDIELESLSLDDLGKDASLTVEDLLVLDELVKS